jgi:hypothetical protein
MSDESPLTMTRTRFAGPPPPDPLDPAVTTVEPASPPSPPAEGSRGPAAGATAAAGTGTSTSSSAPAGSRRDDVAKGMARALVGLLVFPVLAARFLLRRRGVEVIDPTRDQREAIAAPLGRIGARHVPVELAPTVVHDLFDVGELAGAVTEYLDGAVLVRHAGGPPHPPMEVPE